MNDTDLDLALEDLRDLRDAVVEGNHDRFRALLKGLIISGGPTINAAVLRHDPWECLPSKVAKLIGDRRDVEQVKCGVRPGTRSLTFHHFAELAAVYEASSRVGLVPTEQVVLWADISKAAAQKRILRARELGFLPSPQRGHRRAWVDVKNFPSS